VSHPSKAGFVVEADWHQRLLMRFTLKDKSTKESIIVHQAFVKLTNEVTGQEIIFVAEPDTSKSYRFDMVIPPFFNANFSKYQT
jgi:oligosaccharyltransferase complex subunit delta (ribophorin II)